MRHNLILSSALFIVSFFFVTPISFAQSYPLKAVVDIKDPAKPNLVLTNTGTTACQVVNTAYGTVSVVKMSQSGTEISPLPIQVYTDDSIEAHFNQNLKTLQPSASTVIPLQVFPYRDNLALRTVTWSKLTGAYGMIYPFQKNIPYTLELRYSPPITDANGAPLCDTVTATIERPGNQLFATRNVLPFLAGIGFLVLLLLLIFLFKSRKNKKKIATIALFLLVAISVATTPAQADYSVPTDSTAEFNACMDLFNEYPEITDPILSDIDPETIYIFTNDSRHNDATDWPDGSYHVFWDPRSEYDYPGGAGVPSMPCDRLFHELYHVYEISNGINSREDCAGSGISRAEVNATRAQNQLREAMGLPPRTHYGYDPLPSGSCDEEPEPPPPSPGCGFSCATSWGEPHIRVFDGRSYDFQAVGEFIAATTKDRNFTVQIRQQPYPTSEYVAINAAVAMKVGTDTVELRMEKNNLIMVVNGQESARTNQALPGGGTIAVTPGEKTTEYTTVQWPDGAKVVVTTFGVSWFDVFIDSPLAETGQLEGIFATTPGDTPYSEFADRWRITNEISLFTYQNGATTETFTNKSFPKKSLTIADLPNKQVAEAICKSMGITDPSLLNSCIFDVGLTGRPEFAYSSSLVENVVPAQPPTPDGTWNMAITKIGDSVAQEFPASKGDILFFDIPRTTFPAQCGGFGVRNTENEIIASGCITSGSGFVDRFEIPETGTYSFFFQPAAGATGTAAVTMHQVQDVTGTIIPGTVPFDVELKTPGAVAKLTFDGVAGQRISVRFSGSTLPDQCGGIFLSSPEGDNIGSTCITNGEGTIFEEGFTVKETGTYTITIDPGNTGKGAVQVEVILSDI